MYLEKWHDNEYSINLVIDPFDFDEIDGFTPNAWGDAGVARKYSPLNSEEKRLMHRLGADDEEDFFADFLVVHRGVRVES